MTTSSTSHSVYLVHWGLINDFLYPVGLEFLIEILLLFYLLTVRVPPCESENIPILQENQPYTDWKQKLWTAVECSQSLGFDHIPWSSSVNGMYSGVTRTEPLSPDKDLTPDIWGGGGVVTPGQWLSIHWRYGWILWQMQAKWTLSIEYFSTEVCSQGY